MKRFGLILAALTVPTLVLCGTALAKEMSPAAHNRVGPGFHSVEAPLGIRWWMGSQKFGIDLGLGFGSDPAAIDPTESEKHWAIEAGVPIVCHSWDRAHALIRPGILYQSQQIGFDADGVTPGIQFDTVSATALDVMLEGEAEVFLVDNVSISAAHGIGLHRVDPGFGADSQTSFGTRGNNFTTIGFHIYMFR